MDDSGTINPAALTGTSSSTQHDNYSPSNLRGKKRSRSPGNHGAHGLERDSDDAKHFKRSRVKPHESSAAPPSIDMSMAATMSHQPVQTPQLKTQSLAQTSPSQASPPRSTPTSATKPHVIKALPTVRDHTTDQLNPEGDEYIPRETDPDGDRKVDLNGRIQGDRKYKCRTFEVPHRGHKLFMLATECARVLSYRDSYLLFNKNRSLFKIIASQAEKEHLIQQEILPYSYRSRQIAIVTARSMFRQFGSRLITDGRRVRDDYWEAKARKQGFTEEDAAGEKRPGMTKQKQEQQEHPHAVTSLPQGEVVYANSGAFDGQPPGLGHSNLAALPAIMSIPADDLNRPGMMGGYARPRQELGNVPYVDRIQPATNAEMLAQAANAAEFNKQLKDGRTHREGYLQNYWSRPHEQPVTEAVLGQAEPSTIAPQTLQSPQATNHARGQQDPMAHTSTPYASSAYPTYPNQQNPIASPGQQMHRTVPPNQLHPSSPSMGMGSSHRQTPSYGNYGSNQMWPPQVQPSPLSQSPMSSYGGQPQMHPQMGPSQMQPTGLNYPQMSPMGNTGYPGVNRSVYQQGPGQQYNATPNAGPGAQPSMQGWPNSSGSGPGNMSQKYGYQ